MPLTALLALLPATVVTACSSRSAGPPPRVVVVPLSAMLDAPVRVSVTGLPARARVEVTAEQTDADGVPWRSSAQFVADGSGTVGLDRPSLGGSYTGVNAMGLFELMRPTRATTATALRFSTSVDVDGVVTLTARVDGRVAATATTRRLVPLAHGVTAHRLTLARDGVFGVLFLPPADVAPAGRHTAVLAFGGSEGGLASAGSAEMLAAHGFPALALAYFHEPGLPAVLRQIPIEYFEKALALLARQPGVDPARIVVWGVSRGSEAAMLLGIHDPSLVHAVIAGSPASAVQGSLPDLDTSAWTWRGRPLPYGSDAVAGLPVEQIQGPLVTVCGGVDAVWASCPNSDVLAARRARHHVADHDLKLVYPEAGHAVGSAFCYVSFTTLDGVDASGEHLHDGGTIEADAIASADAHDKIGAFLDSLSHG